MNRLLKELIGSPVLAIAALGLMAGLALITFGLLNAAARPGPARLVGGFLVAVSGTLILRRLASRAAPQPPPRGGTAVGVKDEEENVIAVDRS